jgi:hypothetical protein
MQEKLRFLGLDVHAETIAVAVAEPDGEVRSLGTIPNRAESIRKMIKKLGPAEKLRALKVVMSVVAPVKSIVPWAWAALANASAKRVGPATRIARAMPESGKDKAHLAAGGEGNRLERDANRS